MSDSRPHVPATATKAGRALNLPLTAVLRDILVARRAIGRERYVFPANSRSGHIEEPKGFLAQVAATTGVVVSAHDLRRVYATVAESADISPLALRALINHSLGNNDVTAGYIQMTAERLRTPAQRVADKLKTLCGIEPVAVDNVTKLGVRL